MTSECTAKAVEDACISLKAKLAPYRAGGSSFEDAVAKAMKDGAILSAAGSWTNPVHGTEYSTCGVACTEAEVDVLSGEVQVCPDGGPFQLPASCMLRCHAAQILSTNIMMDLGTALNPAVDIGQLEGGFVMALGYVLTEEVLFDEEGQPLNIGTWNYKIPSAHDIPLELNVELLDRSSAVELKVECLFVSFRP